VLAATLQGFGALRTPNMSRRPGQPRVVAATAGRGIGCGSRHRTRRLR
jgi:hypothetical protein